MVPFGCHVDGILARQIAACVKSCFSFLVRDLHSRRIAGFSQDVIIVARERRWTRDIVTVMRLIITRTAYKAMKLGFLCLISWKLS